MAPIRLVGPIDAEDAQTIYVQVASLLTRGVPEIVCDPQGTIDLSVLEVLARLRLMTRRCGATLRLSAQNQEVEDLVSFAGLDDAMSLWRDC